MTQFDPKAIQEKVGGMVKGTMIGLLPDAQFQALVEKEWKAFFEEPQEKVKIQEWNSGSFNGPKEYSVTAGVTPFRAMVWGAMIPEMQRRLQELMQTDDWRMDVTRQWIDNKEEVHADLSEAMEKRFQAMAMEMVGGMFRNMMVHSAEAVKRDLMTATNNPNLFNPNAY